MKNSSKIIYAAVIAAFLFAPLPVRAFRLKTPASSVQRKIYRSVGVIESVNRKESWIKIKHENIPGVMPAMTMVFEVRAKKILANRKVGRKIEFWFEEKSFIVVRIKNI